ncbi:AI-2E family transporter [Anaplasma capra]|nr:AI-2E family transporter [Anaplasma capra]
MNYLLGAGCFAALTLVMWPVLPSCCVAAVVAYLLNPLVNRLESVGLPRPVSSFIIVFSSVSLLTASLVFLVPVVYSQTLEIAQLLADKLPLGAGVEGIKNAIRAHNVLRYGVIDAVNSATLSPSNLFSSENAEFIKLLSMLYKNFTKVVVGVVQSGVGIGSIAVKMLITLLLSFYILSSWPVVVKNILLMVPRRHLESFSHFMSRVDNIVSAYIRGQTSVCIVMSIYYCICFTVASLGYSLVLGFVSGIMTFIPYVGPVLCAVLGVCLALLQGFSWTNTAAVVLIFVVGNVVESNIVTPVLISKKLDLNPGWVVVGVVVFSAHAGFLGALVSIPVTAIVGVLTQFAVEKYKRSSLYLGE